MRKIIFLSFIFFLINQAILFADISLSCATTGYNSRSDPSNLYDISYSKTSPSRFSAVIEITSPGKVIGRLIGSSETGNLSSPFVGTIDDTTINMNHKWKKIDERGEDFIIDLISGLFEKNMYVLDGKYWIIQSTGICSSSN